MDIPESQTIIYSTGSLQIAGLSCSENLTIQGTTSPCTLIVTDASFVRGDLLLGNSNTRLQVDDRLDIDGMFLWANSATLTGAGKTYSNGGAQISDIVFLDTHRLVFDGNSTSVGDGRVDLVGASVFEIRPGSTYEHQGGKYFLNGWFDDRFVNGGTPIKAVDTGESVIYAYTSNSGLIHVQTGTLKFYLGGGSSGDFLADPGAALDFTGGHVFLPGSGIVADNVFVSAGISAANTVRGTYNVAIATTVRDGQGLTFTDEANIVGYGSSFYIPRGNVAFNAVVLGVLQQPFHRCDRYPDRRHPHLGPTPVPRQRRDHGQVRRDRLCHNHCSHHQHRHGRSPGGGVELQYELQRLLCSDGRKNRVERRRPINVRPRSAPDQRRLADRDRDHHRHGRQRRRPGGSANGHADNRRE